MSEKPFAITLDAKTSLENKTGSWRNEKPVYVDRIPPCNVTCPAGNNVQAWLAKVQECDIKAAWNILIENNPLPSVIGRVCYHPCELTCNRSQYDSSVNICLIEKYIGDTAIKEGWKFSFTRHPLCKTVLIIGSGPAGLTAAYFLKRFGYSVTICEKMPKLGGMLRYGIPQYRLSRKTLDYEIQRIIDTGITVRTNCSLLDVIPEFKNFDAIFIASGSHVAVKTNITPCEGNVMDAVDVLRKVELEGPNSVNFGKHVVVYGGGNTAIDVARTAIRCGCDSVKIVYRRSINLMPAHRTEIDEAIAEGVELVCLKCIESVQGNKVVTQDMYIDEGSLTATGRFGELYADSVILAVGQSIDSEQLTKIPGITVSDKGVIDVNDQMMTAVEGIFAGGDVIGGKKTVTTAIGHGKKAAKCIDAFLRGEKYTKKEMHEVATIKKLNLNYYQHTERIERTLCTSKSFDECGLRLHEYQAVTEAQRCMSCGNCMSCDNCLALCPDNAVKRNELGLYIDYDYCKGCGICARECPCGSIKMESEDK